MQYDRHKTNNTNAKKRPSNTISQFLSYAHVYIPLQLSHMGKLVPTPSTIWINQRIPFLVSVNQSNCKTSLDLKQLENRSNRLNHLKIAHLRISRLHQKADFIGVDVLNVSITSSPEIPFYRFLSCQVHFMTTETFLVENLH